MSECTGGEATCTTLAVCTVCGNAYGELKEHNYGEWLASVDNENRVRSCVNCDATETANLKTVYLNPQSKSNGTWISDDAWFAAYFFGNGEVWVKMTDENNDGIYECAIPSGFTSIILCRMDPTKTTLSWDSKWNQSLDLVLEAKKDSYTYTFKDWSAAEGKCNFDVVATHSECVYNIANATCENAKKCVICDYIAQSALGHAWDNGVITTDPTCEDKGVKTYTCGTCGDTYTETIDKLGHDMSDFVVTSAPSCTKEGEERSDCSRCDYFETNVLDIVDHTHTTYTSNNDATCTQDGTKTSVCDVCGGDAITVTDTGSSLDHTVEIDEAVAATCTATGKTEGKHCSVCNTVLVAQEIVAAKGHTEVIDDAVAPSCNKTGLTEGKHCSVCEAVLVAQSEVPMVAHTYDDIYDAFCNVCGHKREDAACAHTETEVVEGYAATCTTPGLTDGAKCVKCGEIVTAQTTIDALGHTEVIDAAVDATCTATGLTEGKHCSVCNEVLVAQTVVPALGHDYESSVTKEATCTVEGVKTYTCKNDASHTYTEAIQATGHSHSAVVTAPTCGSDGYTTYTCDCGDTYTAHKVPATDNHTGGTATCVSKAVCETCNNEYGEKNAENHTSNEYTYSTNGNGTHVKKYACCGANVGTENCSGGTATATKQAICDYCGEKYGQFEVTIYVKNIYGWTTVNCYIWNNNHKDGAGIASWPGTAMTSDGSNWYKYTFKSDKDFSNLKVIFNNGSSETPTFSYNESKPYCSIGVWYSTKGEADTAYNNTLFLKPNSNWTQANARFAAYFFGNGETWVSMTDNDGDGIYECKKPTNKTYPSVIFCRMNPSTSANNWNNKWDQTGDLTVPSGGNNCYTVKDGTWSKGGGTWSKK